MLILGAFYLVLVIASIPALIYIDPISRTSAVSAALSIIMLSLGGLSHMAYRTTNVIPYGDTYRELKPHIAILIIMIIAIVGLKP